MALDIDLIKTLSTGRGTVGIVGLGYVGLPLAMRFADAGVRVIGFDIDEKKVEQLNSGESYIAHFSDESVRNALSQGLKATTDFSEVGNCDALILCVPTPLTAHREPDLSFITSTVDALVPYLRKGQVVSLESTTYPGTTQEVVRPRIESTGLQVGQDIFLVYSPERRSG